MGCNDQKLRKKERLKLKKDFENLRRHGKVVKYKDLILVYIENMLEFNRLGIVVKRKFGKSYLRNKFKRYVREFFRRNKCKFKKGYDILIIPKFDMNEHFKGMNYRDFEKRLCELFEKGDLLTKQDCDMHDKVL